MTDVTENKRLNDEELEAVAGGVTGPALDPSMLPMLGLPRETHGSAASQVDTLMVTPHAAPPPPTHDVLHTDLNSMPTTAAALTHSPLSGGAVRPIVPMVPIKR